MVQDCVFFIIFAQIYGCFHTAPTIIIYKYMKKSNSVALLFSCVLLLAACGQTPSDKGAWKEVLNSVIEEINAEDSDYLEKESIQESSLESEQQNPSEIQEKKEPAEKLNQQGKQKKYSTYAVAFYNVENLFDTIDDPKTNDADFLPDGSFQWDTEKYTNKIINMSTVLADIATDQNLKYGAAVIGLAEVENRSVCNDLLKSKALNQRGYKVLHFDSPDRRGIDCAMLYNPKLFKLEDSLYVQYINPEAGSNDWLGFKVQNGKIVTRELFGDKSHLTRGFLVGIGTMAGEKLAVIVNHWPSRGSESYMRERAGRQVKRLIEALQECYPGIKVIAMGDLNDDPDNKSLSKSMGCKYTPADVSGKNDIFNPWLHMLRTIGQGTLLYNGEWNLFDQILMTGNMVDKNMILVKQKPSQESINTDGGLTFYFCEVVRRDYMTLQSGRSKGGPKRTTSGGEWKNGYSDHFPTCIYLLKEK